MRRLTFTNWGSGSSAGDLETLKYRRTVFRGCDVLVCKTAATEVNGLQHWSEG